MREEWREGGLERGRAGGKEGWREGWKEKGREGVRGRQERERGREGKEGKERKGEEKRKRGERRRIHCLLHYFILTASGLGKEEYRRSPSLSPGSTSLWRSHHTAVGLALAGDSSGGLAASSEG